MYFFIFRYVGGLWYDDGEFVHSEILNWEKSVCGGVWEGVSSTEDQDEKVCSGVNNTPVQPRINNSSNNFLGKVQGEWSLLCRYEIKVSKSIWAGESLQFGQYPKRKSVFLEFLPIQ